MSSATMPICGSAPIVRTSLPSPNTPVRTPSSMAAWIIPSTLAPEPMSSVPTFNSNDQYNFMRSYISLVLLVTVTLTSCTKNLNREPANTNTADNQYANRAGYKQVLAKVYGSYALISSSGTGN